MKFPFISIFLFLSLILNGAEFETGFMIKQKDKTIAKTAEGQSKIVFYRDDFKDANNCCFVDVYLDGAFCGQLRKQQFIEVDCSPGQHNLIFKYWVNETTNKDKPRLFNFSGKSINCAGDGIEYVKLLQIAKFTNGNWYDFNHVLKYGNIQLDSAINKQVVRDYYINYLKGSEYVYDNDILYEVETKEQFSDSQLGGNFLVGIYTEENIKRLKDECSEGRSVWFLPPTYPGVQIEYHKTEASYLLGLSLKKIDSGRAKGSLCVGAVEMTSAEALNALKKFNKMTLPLDLKEKMRLSISDFHNHEQWNTNLTFEENAGETGIVLKGMDGQKYYVNYSGDKRDYYRVSLLEKEAWENFARSVYMGSLTRAAQEEVKQVEGLESMIIQPNGKAEKGAVLGSVRVY